MTTKTTKTIFSITALSAIVLSVLVASSLIDTAKAKADVFVFEKDESIKIRATPQELLDEGVNSAIVISANQKNADLTRGVTTGVKFTVTHLAGTNPVPKITLQADGIKGLVLPASRLALSTPEDRAEEFKRTGTVSGAIDLSPLVIYEPSEITLAPGESKTIEMRVVMPKSWNTELSGTTVNFEPNIKRIGDYGSYKIAVFSDDADIKIGG
ncbi:MAG: hypothetical protein HZA84_00845 [Thaumarchaeota archaeon]|nr:hypothetical protein [Nitrososphaerota archaeon]